MKERIVKPQSGWFMLAMVFLAFVAAVVLFTFGTSLANRPQSSKLGGVVVVLSLLLAGLAFISLFGFMAIPPNMARVLLLFGEYRGTVRDSGFFWVNPFYSKRKISLRVRNFETGSEPAPAVSEDEAGPNVSKQVAAALGKLKKTRTLGKPTKVNDRDGNPIEISAVVVWKVVDTYEAMFEVDDYEDYVAVQSEAALRNLASRFPYDSHDHEVSLRGNPDEVSEQLQRDIQARLQKAGVKVLEARISYLAYAPEIAAAMLQRQQAQAIVAARTRIVDGAVGMVQMALQRLAEDQVVELDEERKAAMVSNLLVVLCGDRSPQPVLNAGTIYH